MPRIPALGSHPAIPPWLEERRILHFITDWGLPKKLDRLTGVNHHRCCPHS
ncbi:hypothetical protein ACQ4M3_32350 [Leptolyngbya sp. AN03gr2]|uniref:hypothetical protein n=1 Tax=unclassified Leptolyngbya TaxID=2650499 RepID=UPI003D31818D